MNRRVMTEGNVFLSFYRVKENPHGSSIGSLSLGVELLRTSYI